MKTFELTLFDGHPIIHDKDNIILIDTGAPKTIHNSNHFNFLAEVYETSANFMGLTPDKLSQLMGTPVTTLIGVDVLKNYIILLDYRNLQVSISKKNIEFDSKEMIIQSFMGIPIIEVEIEGRNLRCFLDSGAKLSYLPKSLTINYPAGDLLEDFYPGFGRFETRCYEIMTRSGSEDFMVRYGNLPQMLEMSLMLGGVEGILGYDFFKNFKVYLDLKNSRLKFAS